MLQKKAGLKRRDPGGGDLGRELKGPEAKE